MDREEYIKQRKTNKFNLTTFYTYYKERGGTLKINEFSNSFQAYLQVGGGIDTMLSELDNKFNITLVLKDQQLIDMI